MTNPPSNSHLIDRERALNALKTAEAYIQSALKRVDPEALALLERALAESTRIQQANASFVLALLTDEYCPAEMFKAFASVQRIREWRDDPAIRLDVQIKHNRCCVRPSEFFTFWRSLPD